MRRGPAGPPFGCPLTMGQRKEVRSVTQESPLVVTGTISFIDERAQQLGMKLTGSSTSSPNTVVDEIVVQGIPTILSDHQPIPPGKVLPGVEAILVLGNDGADGSVVYVPPPGSLVVFLTASECKALGGNVVDDGHCPLVGPYPDGQYTRKACATGCGWLSCDNQVCIDEVH
jgi:hypothetical protein